MQALHCLGSVLRWIHTEKLPNTTLRNLDKESFGQTPLAGAVSRFAAASSAQKLPLDLKADVGYTPLRGIDMPFHSSYFRVGVPQFHELLLKHIRETDVQPAKLIDRYVPNVTARPFQLTREYFAYCYELTQSARLREVLEQVRIVLPEAQTWPHGEFC